jgi:hypothetical protein
MYWRYVLWVGVFYAACVTCVTGAAFWLEPLSGDLTRLGGYAERDFGWRKTQSVFVPPLAATSDVPGPADVVVIGDSFSSRTSADRQTLAGGFWTDFLAHTTGLGVRVHDVARMPVERYVATQAFTAYPPRAVILEVAERTLLDRLGRGAAQCDIAENAMPAQAFPGVTHRVPSSIPRSALPRLQPQIGSTVDYMRKSVIRAVFGMGDAGVVRLGLVRGDLFTNREAGSMLAYAEDRLALEWPDSAWSRIRCGAAHLRQLVEANGRTVFLLVVAPDKSRAYAKVVTAGRPDAMRARYGSMSQMLAVEAMLQHAVSQGVQDLYLPNDTHWGSAGSQLVAELVARCLAGICAWEQDDARHLAFRSVDE